MDFTENQHQSFKRISRLGIVALLHVVLLAALLNSMKIRIIPINPPPILVAFEKPKPQTPEEPKKFDNKLPLPKDPVFQPKTEVTPIEHSEPSVVANTTADPGEVVGKHQSGEGNDTGTGPTTSPQVKPPHHVSAVINMNACEKPVYPVSAIRLGETGAVTLSMLIGTDGRVIDTKILESSGSRALDRAANQALSLCRFTPGTIDGVPQQSWTKVQYVWKLD